MEYRRRTPGNERWHWCRNCSNWPTSGYQKRPDKPPHGSGELCDECRDKEKNGDCQS